MSLNTYFGVERVVRDAFERAARRPRKHLTLVHKTNVLVHSGQLWSRVVEEVSMEYPDVTVAYSHIDAAMIYLVTDPGRFDVVVTDNLFGDIFTDLAAAVSGGIGLAASGNLDVSRTNPSMFEPVHGSAPGHRRHRVGRPDRDGAVDRAAARSPRAAGGRAPGRGSGGVRPGHPAERVRRQDLRDRRPAGCARVELNAEESEPESTVMTVSTAAVSTAADSKPRATGA